MRISINSLDLTDPTAVTALDARVLRAARSVCRRNSHSGESAMSQHACVTDTVNRAWMQIDGLAAREGQYSARAAPHRAAS